MFDKTRRSAGVPVTKNVHRLLIAANLARDKHDWSRAVEGYREALRLDPALAHIHVQLGHALAEQDDLREATLAYRRASVLRPDDGEPHLYLAMIARRSGHTDVAVRHMLLAHLCGDHLVQTTPVLRQLSSILASLSPSQAREAILDALRTPWPADDEDAEPPLLFDVTDFCVYVMEHRILSGIQRVQVEIISALLESGAHAISLCCCPAGHERWVAVSLATFKAFVGLSGTGSGDEDAWDLLRGRLMLETALQPPYDPPRGATLVNLGTSMRIYNYFLLIRQAMDERAIRYVPFVHDLIPYVVPQYCLPGVTEEFLNWLLGAFGHANGFLVNSRSTALDLMRASVRLGCDLTADQVEIVSLDAGEKRGGPQAGGQQQIVASGDRPHRPFVLFVSTIEIRKNHVLAFEAWGRLVRRHGAAAVPRLICVGRVGWMCEEALERARSPDLADAVTLVHDISDQEIGELLRTCMFVIYPSHYEGWGLPVTEALCHGKVPVVADNSSLAEAGAGFAMLFTSGSVGSLTAALEEMIFDAAGRAERERRIAEQYRPRSWAQVADQVLVAVERFVSRPSSSHVPPPLRTGIYHPLKLYKGSALWKGLFSAEVFRRGRGWLWPDSSGCRIKPEGADLFVGATGLPAGGRIYVHVEGLASAACMLTISFDGRTVAAGRVRARARRWFSVDMPVLPADAVLTLQGSQVETVSMSLVGSELTADASVKILGFLVADRQDEMQRVSFLESVIGESLENESVYRSSSLDAVM